MRTILTSAALAVVLTASAGAADKAELAAEGKGLIQEFGGALKAELMAAMQEGGPINAISVCNTRAPEIAGALSSSSGWTVARSSHRLRNPGNAPDAYTKAAIEDFLAREAKGEKAEDMVRAEIVEEAGAKVFRMVKAIPTAKQCLACHGGDEVAPEVAAKLAELYPDDAARGFEEGQMRGVFTLSKPLE